MADNNIGSARRAYAKRSNIAFTQDDAASYFGVSLGTYRNWEQGRTEPSGAQISNIAKLYGTTIDYLLGVEPKVEYAYLRISLDSEEKKLLELYGDLSDDDRRIVMTIVERLAR